MSGVAEVVGGIIKDWIPNPYDEFRTGQARDEARGVRSGDLARDDYWKERESIGGRIREGMAAGLSKMAAAGIQPSSSMTATVGQDTGYTAMSQRGQSYDPLMRKQVALLDAQIESQKLDNLKKSQSLTEPTVTTPGSGFVPGSNMSNKINEQPMDRTTSLTGYSDPGAVNSIGYHYWPDGSVTINPSADLKERIEDDALLELNWKHQVNMQAAEIQKSLPPGRYRYNPATLTFTPVRADDRSGLAWGHRLYSWMPWNRYRPTIKGDYEWVPGSKGGRTAGSYLNHGPSPGYYKYKPYIQKGGW